MKRKFLEDLGLDKETIDKILDENSNDIGQIKQERDDAKTELKNVKGQLEESTTTIETLKKNNQGNEELQKEVESYKDKISALESDHQTELKNLKVDAAIQSVLGKNKAKYPELLATKFDREKLKLSKDGNVEGIEEQLRSLQENYKDMFTPVVTGNEPPNPDTGGSGNVTYDSLVKNADTMTAEEIAAQFETMNE